MKKALAIVLAALLVLGLLLIAGLLAGQKAVNRRLAEVLPDASARAKLPMTASALSASLWTGSAAVEGLSIGNPPGFPDQPMLTLAAGQASLRYLPLLSSQARLKSLTLTDLRIHVTRLADKSLNIKRKTVKAPPVAPPDGQPAPVEAPETAPKDEPPPPQIGIDRLLATLTLTYTDFVLADEGRPFEALFQLELTGSGLATYGAGADEASWADVKAQGYMESGGKRAPIRLAGKVAPLLRPSAPTFNLTGSIEKIDAGMLPSLLGKNAGIRGEAERVDLVLVAAGGRFDESQSKIVLTLKNLNVGGRILETATLALPLRGTLDRPKLRTEQAIFDLIAQVLAAPPPESSSSTNAPPGRKHKKNGLDMEAISKGLESLFRNKP